MKLTSWNSFVYHWCKEPPSDETPWGVLDLGLCRDCKTQFRMTNLLRHLQRVSIWREKGHKGIEGNIEI